MKIAGTNIKELSPEELSQKLHEWNVVKKLGPKLEKRAKELIESGTDIPGFSLRGTGVVNSISSMKDAYGRVRACLGDSFSEEDWADICKISFADIVKFYERCTGDKDNSKGKVSEMLENVLEIKEKAKCLQEK